MGASVSKLDAKNIKFHEKIGQGGFGSVKRLTFKTPYKGHTEAAGKTVVHGLGQKEVEVMSKLNHPNIVELLGICDTGGAQLIVMEYAPNGSLHDYLKDQSKPLPYDLQKKWAREAALAINYLHQHNFLHRDIKPSNCLLFPKHHLKLCDFGIAREIEESQTTSSQKGTYRYMAPEIHVGNQRGRAIYSRPSDIWGYGMLLLEICTRKPPFPDFEGLSVVFKVGSGAKPSIPEGCPKDFADIMQQCWESDPKQRPTIGNVVAALFPWKLGRTVYPYRHQDTYERKLFPDPIKITNVASCPNGDIVCIQEVSSHKYSILTFDGNGKYKSHLPQPILMRAWDSIPRSFSVSQHGYVLAGDYNLSGPLISRICVFNMKGELLNNIPVLFSSIGKFATDREGQVLVIWINHIFIYTCPEGKLVKEIKLLNPDYTEISCMAVNGKNQILLATKVKEVALVAIDYSGNTVFRFTLSDTDDILKITGIACGVDDKVYLALHTRTMCPTKDSNGSFLICDTGRIHVYSSSTGQFLQCITRTSLGCVYSSLSITPEGSLLVLAEKITAKCSSLIGRYDKTETLIEIYSIQ